MHTEEHVEIYSYEKAFTYYYSRVLVNINNSLLFIFFTATIVGGIVTISTMVRDVLQF